MQKEATVKASLEANDLMVASMVAPSVGDAPGSSKATSLSSVALEKVKLAGAINTNMEKITISIAKVDAKYAKVCSALAPIKVGNVAAAVKEFEESLQTHLTHAKVHFTKTGEEGKQLQASLVSLTTMSEVKGSVRQ